MSGLSMILVISFFLALWFLPACATGLVVGLARIKDPVAIFLLVCFGPVGLGLGFFLAGVRLGGYLGREVRAYLDYRSAWLLAQRRATLVDRRGDRSITEEP